jgi:hypothetical protein
VDDFPGVKGWIPGELSDENAANRLTLICIDLPNIRARANSLTGSQYDLAQESEAKGILELAQMVDSNLQQWYETLPQDWQYRTVGMVYEIPDDVSQAESWIGPQHAYHDVSLASIVNDYRVCRIFCQRVIMACVTWLSFGSSFDGTEVFNNAIYVIQQMADEISACVTFHMSYELQPMAQQLGQEKNGRASIGHCDTDDVLTL